MTTFDRYLLRRFLHVFAILFVTTFGLFVVIDGFTNVDAFQEGADGSLGALLQMARYYTFQSSLFFEVVGPILSVISVVIVFALLAKHSEVHPILAAGVPTYRLIVPLLVGILLVNGALVANQEWIIPQIAHRLQEGRKLDGAARHVEPVYDSSLVLVSGQELFLDNGRMADADFVLPVPQVVDELTTLHAGEAAYYEKTERRPAGWYLRKIRPRYEELSLTAEGRKIVRQLENPSEAFLVTDVSPDQLYNRSRNFAYLSTPELLRRIRNPGIAGPSVRSQTLHLHGRLTQPLVGIAAVLIAVPLILRRESTGLVTNMAVCTLVLGLVFGAGQIFHFLGTANLLPIDLAAWASILMAGTLGAWLSGSVQT